MAGLVQSRRARLVRRALPLIVLAAVAAVVVLGLGSPTVLVSGDTLGILTQLLAAAYCVRTAVVSRGRMCASWALFALLLLLWVAGDVLWLVHGGAEGEAPILSLADALYLVGLVPAVVGLGVYPTARGVRRVLGPLVLDALVIGSSALLVCYVLALGEVTRDAGDATTAFMYVVYPVTDLVMACLVALLLLRGAGAARLDLLLIGATFTTYLYADTGYALAGVRGEDYAGTLVDLAYVVAPLLLGVAAIGVAHTTVHPRELRLQFDNALAQLSPDLAALLALALCMLTVVNGPTMWAMTILVLSVTAWRQMTLTKDNHRLRIDLEERVEQRTEELEQLTEQYARIDAIRHGFVTAVSHELRTPLTAIRGSLEILEDGDAGPMPAGAQSVVALAARGTERLTRLVNDIIDLERLESGTFDIQPHPHALSPLLEEATRSLQPLAEDRGVGLVLSQARGTAMCDPDRVVQAVVNLVGNALKFTPVGGQVEVATLVTPHDVLVRVTDTGRGIPQADLGRIFDRFSQVEVADSREKGGAGLGLTITKSIVERHGGRIWAESQPGEGSTFVFTLPRAVEETPAVAVVPDEPQAVPTQRTEQAGAA